MLGALLEKQRLTPDAYPLTLNALRAACNQSTSREPVLELDDAAVRGALAHLTRRGWVRLASGSGSRAAKYRHLLAEALGLSASEQALLALLLLRGAQTAAELRARSERLHRFAGPEEVESTLEALAAREMVVSRGRRPGEKEERHAHRLSEELRVPGAVGATASGGGVERLEAALGALRGEMQRLRAELDSLRAELGVDPPA